MTYLVKSRWLSSITSRSPCKGKSGEFSFYLQGGKENSTCLFHIDLIEILAPPKSIGALLLTMASLLMEPGIQGGCSGADAPPFKTQLGITADIFLNIQIR